MQFKLMLFKGQLYFNVIRFYAFKTSFLGVSQVKRVLVTKKCKTWIMDLKSDSTARIWKLREGIFGGYPSWNATRN